MYFFPLDIVGKDGIIVEGSAANMVLVIMGVDNQKGIVLHVSDFMCTIILLGTPTNEPCGTRDVPTGSSVSLNSQERLRCLGR